MKIFILTILLLLMSTSQTMAISVDDYIALIVDDKNMEENRSFLIAYDFGLFQAYNATNTMRRRETGEGWFCLHAPGISAEEFHQLLLTHSLLTARIKPDLTKMEQSLPVLGLRLLINKYPCSVK